MLYIHLPIILSIYELFAALPASSVGDTPLPVDSSTFTLLSIYILSYIHTIYLYLLAAFPACPVAPCRRPTAAPTQSSYAAANWR